MEIYIQVFEFFGFFGVWRKHYKLGQFFNAIFKASILHCGYLSELFETQRYCSQGDPSRSMIILDMHINTSFTYQANISMLFNLSRIAFQKGSAVIFCLLMLIK